MSEKRECRIIVACGKRGVGKSVETVRMIYDYVNGNPAKGVAPRKALIFDVNDEFSDFWFDGEQHSIKAIAMKDIIKFSVSPYVEVRRVRPFWDDGRRMNIGEMGDALSQILDSYRNGLLLVEDVNKYTGDYVQTDLIGALATSRHIGLDLVMHFQGIGRSANPKIIGNCNFIRLHKTNDTVKRHKLKFEDKTEMLQLAELIVDRKFENSDTRFFLYVDVDNSKIVGNFTKDDATQAIKDYLDENNTKLIKPIINKRDENGKKMYDHKSAYKIMLDRLYKTYFMK